jgi:kynurenine formamidase/GNAT superfamily N-acetyltransferase
MNYLIIQLNSLEANVVYKEISATFSEVFQERKVPKILYHESYSFGYMQNGICLGVVFVEFPFLNTAHIPWMGVRKTFLNQGIEKALLNHVEMFCLEKQIYSLSVETLSPKESCELCLNKFEFYIEQGFRPLFEIFHDESNHLIIYLNKTLSLKIFDWIDLTHSLSTTAPTWTGNCGFEHTNLTKYEDCFTDCKFLIQKIEMLAGVGTHLDAPIHCFSDGKSVNEFLLKDLISPCVVINVSQEAHEDYLIELSRIKDFEKECGKHWKQAFVIFHTGWDRYWSQPQKYHNHYRFPSISREVAEYLVSEDVVGIGIDTLSPDRPESQYPVHQVVLGANKYIIENIAHAGFLPSLGGYTLAMPLPIVQGSEAPIRLLGAFPKALFPIKNE